MMMTRVLALHMNGSLRLWSIRQTIWGGAPYTDGKARSAAALQR